MGREYTKPHLSLAQQADLLMGRGLSADRNELMRILHHVGYYRLSAYWYPFRKLDPQTGKCLDDFEAGTTLAKVWRNYVFDRELKRHLLDAIERIEVALRGMLAYYHTETHSPFDYADASYFPLWQGYEKKLMKFKEPQGSARLNAPDYVLHFFEEYGSRHEHLPLWMAMGVADFGFIVFFFQYSSDEIKRKIADQLGVRIDTLKSWLHVLRLLRNDCAHHARVWNRTFRSLPYIPKAGENRYWSYVYQTDIRKWINPRGRKFPGLSLAESVDKIAVQIYICRYLLGTIAPRSHWHERVEKCVDAYEQAGGCLEDMGFCQAWKAHPLWVGE